MDAIQIQELEVKLLDEMVQEVHDTQTKTLLVFMWMKESAKLDRMWDEEMRRP
jgi:hypothetical protein